MVSGIRSISVNEIDLFIPKASSGFYQQDRFIVRPDKIRDIVCEAVTNGYCKVYEHDGEFCGFLIAHVSEMPFFDRLQATILGFQSWRYGAGSALIKDFKKFVDSDPFIRMVGWQNDVCDARVDRFMRIHGFDPSTTYTYVKE